MPIGKLYSKMFVWLFLNLLLIGIIGLVFVVYLLFGISDSKLPSNIFGPNIENMYRVISTNLQYRPTHDWNAILRTYDSPGLTFHLASLDEPGYHYSTRGFIPDDIITIAMEMPRTLFTLCPDPTQVFLGEDFAAYEAGMVSTPPVIFMFINKRFWYGRVLFVPDSLHQPHYLLLATESNTLTGGGLFFNFKALRNMLLIIIAVSCLWWWPFIWHVAKPISRMANYAEAVTSSVHNPGDIPREVAYYLPRKRRDEIGRLAQALGTMAERLTKQMFGQQQFIRYIAHELNSPLARCKVGLELLEDKLDGEGKLDGEDKGSFEESMRELDNLSDLTDDVLAFLRAQSEPAPAKLECIELEPLIATLIQGKSWENQIQVTIPGTMSVWGDKFHIRQAVINIISNSLTYARDCGPITIEAYEVPTHRRGTTDIMLNIKDNGPGVQDEDLASLDEPFFRSKLAQQSHPGGSGLGLAIVKKSIEACQGSVSFANLSGGGFIVSMRLSCAQCAL